MQDVIFSSKRIRCSHCGSKDGFAPLVKYYDVPITGYCSGKCFSCGTFTAPNGKSSIQTIEHAPKVQATAPALNQYERSQLLKRLFNESMANRLNNNFARFMISLLGENLASRSLYYYGIGSDVNNNTVFWHRNCSGELTHAKIISYGTDCKRLKGDFSNITFIDYGTGEIKYLDALNGYAISSGEYLKYEFLSGSKGYDTAHFYGEHLLNPNYKHINFISGGGYELDATAPIVLVESEKTAYLCNLLYPKMLFVACGGSNGITEQKASILQGCTVFIAFDNDASGIESMAKVQHLVPSAIALNPALLGITDAKADLFDYLISDGKLLDISRQIYNHRESFNFNIHLQCDVQATAPASVQKAVA